MATVWAAFFVSVLFYTNSQQIYFYEKNDCISNEKIMEQFQTLLTQQRRNQETLIRLAVVKDEKADVEEVNYVKQSVASTEIMVTTLQQTVEILKRQIDSLRQENERITMNQNKTQEFDEMFNILEENIAEMHENIQIIKKGLKLNSDCKEIHINGRTQSGVYRINPFSNESQVSVYCDMVTEGGGWTAIQKRRSGSISFKKTWPEYKKGFWNPTDSYWIGNDVIHQLTKGRNSSLYVSIALTNGTTLYQLYHQFSVSNETDNYRLFLGGPATGTLGDRMLNSGYSNVNLSGMMFSTPDRDHDGWSGGSCASYGGGWWFNYCHFAFLNGLWASASWSNPWSPLVTDGREIKETVRMIKPH